MNFLKLPFFSPPGWSNDLLFLGFFISFQQHHRSSISLDKLLSILLLFCRRVISFLVLEPPSWEMVGSGQDVFEELDHGGLDPGSLLGLNSPAVRRSSAPSTPWSDGRHWASLCVTGICMKVHHEVKKELLKMKTSLVVLWRRVRWSFTKGDGIPAAEDWLHLKTASCLI